MFGLGVHLGWVGANPLFCWCLDGGLSGEVEWVESRVEYSTQMWVSPARSKQANRADPHLARMEGEGLA